VRALPLLSLGSPVCSAFEGFGKLLLKLKNEDLPDLGEPTDISGRRSRGGGGGGGKVIDVGSASWLPQRTRTRTLICAKINNHLPRAAAIVV